MINTDIDVKRRIWPLELSQHVPLTTRITGYDISSLQFPTKENLPGNVRLEVFDALSGAIPTSLVHAFDVVHLRALVLAVKGGDPGVLISRLAKMLSISLPTFSNYLHPDLGKQYRDLGT